MVFLKIFSGGRRRQRTHLGKLLPGPRGYVPDGRYPEAEKFYHL